MALSIVTYNVNGLRAAIRKGFYDWISQANLDVICLQETKARLEQVDVRPLEAMGYHHYWHAAEKKGYSGVATFTKILPDHIEAGCGKKTFDREGRILRTDFRDWTLLNCYFPSGTSGQERQAIKMRFLTHFYTWVRKLRKERSNLVVVGDYNIAHTEMDIHNPVGNKKNSGFLPEEREWMTKWFKDHWIDSFRYVHPDIQKYSWWTVRHNARKNNKGWRIDYQSVSKGLSEKIVDAQLMNDVEHSDHCPVFLKLDL
jgi:exodeoxyribonuclease-3